ncbi:DUF2147 domain-containing protein [Algoriphagus aquimarinus]|uniref:Uncharacterized conserved protein, DUF2147 family n=1 Tax=Algoriphagus aquimarinus TaxID=237018 RepID=A0A1I0YGY6_9BACT|nr:DUF2147 domain-containing protein [Algoriphagus aquimarinus]SFB11628.1 Uncharacterized conserved protein, DUF2147 family [Algoriphagus aquimarinus]|tara:strand:+ start:12618 stop:13061 length:444 start_codon:yes stop_codon:yes gene_type:complete
MKTYQYTLVCIFFLLLGAGNVHAQSKSKIVGVWFNTDKTAQIEIMENNDEMIGKLIWIQREEGDLEAFTDTVNSDSSLRERPLMGLTILEGLKYKDGIWSDGKIYDPKSGITYTCDLQLKKKDILEIKGYLGDSWVSRTVEWNRVKK